MAKLRDDLIKRRVVPSISKERLLRILAEEGIGFQKAKTWKECPDRDKEAKLARIEQVTRNTPIGWWPSTSSAPSPSSRCGEAASAPRNKPQRLPANYRKLRRPGGSAKL